MNDSGVKVEEAKKKGITEGLAANFDEALGLLAGVLERTPNHPYAHFCRGLILQQQGDLIEAHRHFQRVTEIDPSDAAAWYWLAATVTDANNPARPDMQQLSKKQVPFLEKALERNPYLASAHYRLYMAYRLAGEPQKAMTTMEHWKEMQVDRPQGPPGPGEVLELNYGSMGKYASVINPFPVGEPAPEPAAPPRFEAPRRLT